MEIHLKRGIDTLIFGMTSQEVAKHFGTPDRELINSNDENDLIWEYTEQKLRLTFYINQASRLGYIESSNSDLKLNKAKIIDQKIQDVISLIESKPESWEKDIFDSFTIYFIEKEWLTLHVEYERITAVELGVPFDKDDNYNWPT